MAVMAGPSAAAEPNGTANIKALVGAYNASGQALFQELARKPGNIVLSPYSIGTAMAMARAGARGETERQMTAVLKHGLSLADTDAANAALLAQLDAYGKAPDAPARLSTANALMLAKRADLIAEAYRTLVREKYAAAVFANAGLDEINGWVKERTEGKIDRILDNLPSDAAAVLLNAVYLKAAWASAFAKGSTRDADFHLSAKEKAQVPTMRQQATFPVVDRAGYRAIRLDYATRALGMIIVLPNEVEGADAVMRQLGASEIAALSAALRTAPIDNPVALALPRFKAAFRTGLVEPFQKAGMTLAFKDSADFGGMTGKGTDQEGVKIGDIQHRATIDVAEQGTEAAAATAVVMMPTRASPPRERPKVIPFVVDRPFLFYVVDDASGAILFQGRIRDPRQS